MVFISICFVFEYNGYSIDYISLFEVWCDELVVLYGNITMWFISWILFVHVLVSMHLILCMISHCLVNSVVCFV